MVLVFFKLKRIELLRLSSVISCWAMWSLLSRSVLTTFAVISSAQLPARPALLA